MNGKNPYNCTEPGNLFVGYEHLLPRLVDGFLNGHSFAVLGGRRCGKTSLLLELEKRLTENPLPHFKVMPAFLDIQGTSQHSPDTLFRAFYELVVKGLGVQPWQVASDGDDYQNFLKHLDKAQPALMGEHGEEWLTVLLVDELDAAKFPQADDLFFQNLRNFLMVSRFHRHFRLVATGVKDLASLIISGSSPLNNLRIRHLGVLSEKQARELVTSGFRDGLSPEVESILFELTGKHPYLLQGLLEKLWEKKRPDELARADVLEAAKEFLKEHRDFPRWVKGFETEEHAVYRLLAQASEGALNLSEIKGRLGPSFASQAEDALTVLSYHGVIDDSEPDEPRMVGHMFRDWYVKNVSGAVAVTPRKSREARSVAASAGEQAAAAAGVKTVDDKEYVRIFISYAREDKEAIVRLYEDLKGHGYSLWLDLIDLKGGQEWEEEIGIALEDAAMALICLSNRSVSKRGYINREIRKVLELVEYMPEGGVFLIPVRLEDCDYPRRLSRWQVVDLFEDDGFERLVEAIDSAFKSQRRVNK
jgi:hypothetical protein